MNTQEQSNLLSDLLKTKPKLVWEYFLELSKIPRASGKEQAVMEWLKNIAKKSNFPYYQDSVGNLCIHVPATKGYENSPTVVLQSHADMVIEKSSNSTFNFDTDPLDLYIEDGWLKSRETTLGADNGIGLCMSIAIATDPETTHPPLEILVTVEEETTFRGIFNLDTKALKIQGTYAINLDNQDEGTIVISSAGMLQMSATLPVQRLEKFDPTKKYIQIALHDLPGGHSGMEIHETHRENALIAVAKLLESIPHQLISFNGGDKDNAIPRDAEAIIAVDPETSLTLLQQKHQTEEGYEFYIKLLDPKNISDFTIKNSKIIEGITRLFNGVISFHPTIPNFVQTSSNFASVTTTPTEITFVITGRSSSNKSLQKIFNDHSKILESVGFSVQKTRITPGWNSSANSELVKLALQAYSDLDGTHAAIKAVHVGLEIGSLTNKLETHLNKDIQSIAVGPNIRNLHSPDEKVEISSVAKAYNHLKLLLSLLKK